MSSTSVTRHRARAFREGGPPPAWQSALREYQERKPRRRPSKAIAIHDSTDGPAILRRVTPRRTSASAPAGRKTARAGRKQGHAVVPVPDNG